MNKCDCTSYCGDDPWIMQHKAKPCEAFIRFHPDLCRDKKLVYEAELIPVYLAQANRKLKEAAKAWHDYAALLPVGELRTMAFAVFENIRNAARTGE